MSNYPDDEGRDYVAEQVAVETLDPDIILDTGVTMVRCKCGSLVTITIPTQCKCGRRFCYWKDINSKIKRLDQMDLGHLTNCVRMLGEKAEKYPPELRERFEIALDIFYAEIASRDKEIAQATGILAAINRSLGEK